MTNTEQQNHQACLNRFIDLANQMNEEGVSKEVVSAAMMSASAVYATFVVSGNTGGLTDSGVEKVVAAYKQHLQRAQEIRKLEDDRRRAEAGGDS